MAGAGYKLFNTGDVLTAAQVNTYLMQQTVMVFASSAARTSALSGVLAEGMVSYLQDTNTLEVYDGSAWVGATGDITGLTAGTGISISSATGPVPTITSDVATTFDAKGDLVVGTGADTFSKLTVGNSGDTIVADSSTSTGLRYNPIPAVGRNFAINGAMDIWQRNTTFTVGANVFTYTADRWAAFSSNTSTTVARDTSVPSSNFRYSLKLQRPNGNTGTNVLYLVQAVESNNAYLFAGQTVTVSFWAKTGANYSGGVLNAGLTTGTAADQGLGAIFGSWTNQADINGNKTISSTWTRYSYSGTVQANTLEAGIFFYYTPSGTAGADDALYITGVQLEIGSVPTAFGRAGGNIAGEFLACCRYYQKLMDAAEQSAEMICMMRASSTTATNGGHVQLLTPMRIAPTITLPAVSGNYYYEGGSSLSTISSLQASTRRFRIDTTGVGLTAGQAVWLTLAGSTAQVTASGEL